MENIIDNNRMDKNNENSDINKLTLELLINKNQYLILLNFEIYLISL